MSKKPLLALRVHCFRRMFKKNIPPRIGHRIPRKKQKYNRYKISTNERLTYPD